MDKGGFFLVYRGVFPDFGNAPYVERDAWLWLIASAGYDDDNMGQINTTYSELAKAWNWMCGKEKRGHVVKVKRFLEKLQQKERITLCYNNRVNLLQSCYKNVTRTVCITICNYARYQLKENSPVTNLLQGCYNEKYNPLQAPIYSSLKEKNKINKEIKNKNSTTTKKPKTYEEIEKRLNEIDLASFRDEYGVSLVNSVFLEFSETCLEGTAKKPKPNPYDYVDFRKGFRTWLKKRVNQPNNTQVAEIPLAEQLRAELKRREAEEKRLNNAL